MSMHNTVSLETALQKQRSDTFPRLDIISAETLQAKDFPPLVFVVDQLIVPGMTILAGRPKEGKSWLALSLCNAVATGGKALGGLDCDQGDVLYLALEDNQRRLKSRLQMLSPYDDWPSRLAFATECPRLDDGGLDKIRAWIEEANSPKLVVVDVFVKVRAQKQGSDGGYEADYAAAAPLQRLAIEHGIAILCIHHTRKMPSDDPLEAVSGTNGLTGAADTILVLKREAINTGDAVLYGRGRDFPECELALSFNDATCEWLHVGDASEFRANKEAQEIIDALKTSDQAMGALEIAEILVGVPIENIRKRLKRMSDRGQIIKISMGMYRPV